MKKTLISTALVAVMAAIGFAPTAQAVSAPGGTINITGKVLGATCTVAVNGGATVLLPTVMKTDLATAGATAGATNFNISLTGCDTNTTSATMVFSGTNIDTTTGYLNNTVTGGSTAKIQLLQGTAQINTSTGANAPVIPVNASGVGSTALTAQYIASGAAATAGLVSSTVNFTLTYP
jgi:major type 1 subunit fimbrin (pilin)